MSDRSPLRIPRRAVLAGAAIAATNTSHAAGMTVVEEPDQIRLGTSALEAVIRKQGYVSGVAAGSLLDRRTGFRDAGFGLDIVDWIMEPGSDDAYRDRLTGDLKYEVGNPYHGNVAKRSLEGPQICTQAREVAPEVIRGASFLAVRTRHRYTIAAPGHTPGSLWEQTLVFPDGKRYFLSSDRIDSINGSKAMFLRIDMPGHIKHTRGDTFSEVYLSYHGRIDASEFLKDFAPDARFNYTRGRDRTPKRMIRAYRLRNPVTRENGPWLAGMTLNPADVSEAWCHQRGYVCMIEEFGGRPVRPGESFSAAFLVGYFDSIEEMEQTYDLHAGYSALTVDNRVWKLHERPPARVAAAPRTHSEPLLQERLAWFRDQKLGFMMHWGPYSQWGCIESWPLVEADTWARPDDLPAWKERGKQFSRFQQDYWALNRTFNPSQFDPTAWAREARGAGMRYVVFTTKHHDGFTMWDTRQTDFRITGPECPFRSNPRADVVRQVFDAFRAEGLRVGAYFSKADWHHPDYWDPNRPSPTRNPNYNTLAEPHRWARFRRFVYRQIEELVTGYGPIDILWLDAGQVRPPGQDLQMADLADMARRRQPGLIIVDRTVGGPFENYRTPEQEVPAQPLPYVWETCMTMGDQWSFKPGDRYKSTHRLVQLLIDITVKGGNFLLNVGPGPDGLLPPVALERMRGLGEWLKVNGEAIYDTRPMAPYREGPIAWTRRGEVRYALVPAVADGATPPPQIRLPAFMAPGGATFTLLGGPRLRPRHEGGELVLPVPDSFRQRPPCRHAWVVRIAAR